MSTSMRKKLRIPLYEFDMVVMYDTWERNNKLIVGEDNTPLNKSTQARIFQLKNGSVAVAFNSDVPSNTTLTDTILHESIHLGTCTLNHAGIPISYENDETLAYLVCWFNRKLNKMLKKYIKNQS